MRRAQDRARSATIESRAPGALKLAREARDENVPAKRADFFLYKERMIISSTVILLYHIGLVSSVLRSIKQH